MKSYSIFEINDILKGTIIGSTSQNITSTEELTRARLSDISFIGNKKYEKLWNTSAASIAVVNKDISIEPGENRAFIQVDKDRKSTRLNSSHVRISYAVFCF